MTQSLPDNTTRRDAARPGESAGAVPGWLVSGGLHAVVLGILITSGLPSCGNSMPGSAGQDDGLRDVGVFVKPVASTTEKADEATDKSPPTTDATSTETPPKTPNAPSPVPSPVPAEADALANAMSALPAVDMPSVIGMGTPKPGAGEPVAIPSPGSVLQDGGVLQPSRGGGPGEVSFMGITSTAEKVIFVIDSSASMDYDNAMAWAKTRLTDSIYRLDRSQQFQVVDFNTVPHVMKLHGEQNFVYYRADEHNKQTAVRYVSTIQPVNGTTPIRALRRAFELAPDVIYFLTDGETSLSPADLSEVTTQLNRGRKTAIHCIKFGRGPDQQLAESNFMQLLAAKNRGSYVYRDVLKVARP